MSIYIADIIPIIIAFQSLVFSIVLLSDNGPKRISNRYLAAFLLVLSLQFSAVLTENYTSGEHFFQLSLCAYGFAYGPLLFLYSKSLIYKSFQFKVSYFLHFTPFLIILISAAFAFPLCSKVGVLLYVSLITYIVFAIRGMISYRKVLEKTQSLMSRVNLIWLQWTIIIFCIALLLDIIDQMAFSIDIYAGISSVHLTILLFVNWIFYKGLKQPRLFMGITKLDEELFEESKTIASNKNPDKDEQQELELIKKIMNENEAYTNEDLNLSELAKLINTSPRRLSYLINTFFNQTFMSFVNDFRIKRAMERLENPKDDAETIMEVMYEVGFNSKSSFNTLFKKQTGLTPSEYKRKHN